MKARGNRQVHSNPVWEKLKAKAKTVLEDARNRRSMLGEKSR